jgi:glycosyltransferase involved in cell wall biosynthesis
MMRVKNEGRWIRRAIRSLFPLCKAVYVMDDHSTDNTRAEALNAGATMLLSPFDGFDETRDKNWLLGEVLQIERAAMWIVMIDGDEILEEQAHAPIIRAIAAMPNVQALSFEVVYLWNDEQTRRTDLRTFCRHRASMFRVREGARFVCPPSYEHHGLHCGNVPHGYGAAIVAGARLLHLGYMHKEDRLRKVAWYNEIDPGNPFEDGYRHMIIGDTPELPAESVTKWGGPLKLEAL